MSQTIISSLEDVPNQDTLIALFYGDTGSSKTFTAGSAAYEGRAAMLNIGGGLKTLQSPAFRTKYPLAKDMIIVTITEEINPPKPEAYDACVKAINLLFSAEYISRWDALIIDDMTALRRFAMNEAIQLNSLSSRSNTKTKFSDQDLALPTQGDFGTEMGLTEAFIIDLVQKCRESGKHLICTAHERIRYKKNVRPDGSLSGEETVDKILPGFTGKTFPAAVSGYFDITAHLTPIGAGDSTKYRMRFVANGESACNNKWGGLFKAYEDNLDIPMMLKRIREFLSTGKAATK